MKKFTGNIFEDCSTIAMKHERPVYFSSERGNWETPQDFFDKLNDEFGFTLYVCEEKQTVKWEKY